MAEESLKIGIVMDPIDSITPYKDSSLAMLLEAERRNAEIHYFEQKDLRLLSGKALGQSTLLHVRDDNEDWYELGDRQDVELGRLDAILMRKDPPFDMEYVYTTYILDRAQEDGALIVNAPQALRDMNEKAYTAWFPECTPTTLITRSMDEMKAFLAEHGHRGGQTAGWHGRPLDLRREERRQERQRHFRNADRLRQVLRDGPGLYSRDHGR